MNNNLIFNIEAIDGWKNLCMYYFGKQKFQRAILKGGGIIICTIPANLLNVLIVCCINRPLPCDIVPLYFSHGYHTEKRHVSAEEATSNMLAYINKCQVILEFDEPLSLESKPTINVCQTKQENNFLVTQYVIVQPEKD